MDTHDREPGWPLPRFSFLPIFRCLPSLSVLGLCLGPFWAAEAPGDIVVSEIMYHPPEVQVGEDDQGEPVYDELLEFIELYNDSALAEDLSGWAFVDGVEYTFPAGTILGPEEYLVVARYPERMAEA